MAEEQTGTVLSEDGQKAIFGAVGRLLKSGLYQARLRRALVNGYDPKVLTDFLVLDDVVLAVQRNVPKTSSVYEELTRARINAFLEAQKSAARKLDVRVHDQMERLYNYLRLDRSEGGTAQGVFEGIYYKHDYSAFS